VQYSNWVQGMEGDIDQSHVSFVHSTLNPEDNPRQSQHIAWIRANDKHPRFEVVRTESGVCIGAGRKAPENQEYWRVTQHLMPFHTMTGPYGENPIRNWRAWVPIDDTSCFVIGLSFHPLRPMQGKERESHDKRSGVWTISPEWREPKSSRPFGRWRPIPGLHNDFFIDRQVQRHKTYSGIAEFWAQDAAPQLSMGAICDRTQEHLGTSDTAIIAVRRRLLESARNLREKGVVPGEIDKPDSYALRADAVLIPAGTSWLEATTERVKALAGVNPDCA
jgi:phthalate 4,5-dioxygenase oxygenase subunit